MQPQQPRRDGVERAGPDASLRDADLVRRKDNRLFRNFKRGIVASPSPDARLIDGALWTDHDAGRVPATGVANPPINTLPRNPSPNPRRR